MNLDIITKVLTICLFIFWNSYWWLVSFKANKEKPRKQMPTFKTFIKRQIIVIFSAVMAFQLLFLNILPFPYNPYIQVGGFLIVLTGMTISVLARISLGTNWTHASEFQIKQKHELVTNGVYKYIRHPIYLGLILASTGAEIILSSYLFILFFFLYLTMAFYQGKQEEKILLKRFGIKYKNYVKNSYMLFPKLL